MAAPPVPSPNPKKSIKDIRHKLLHPALTSHYECYITFPSNNEFNNLLSSNGIVNKFDAADTLTVLCSEATLPGSQLATHDLSNDYTGVSQKHAYRRLYDDRADFTFYVDVNYTTIRIFEAWMRFISGEQIIYSENLNNHYRIRYPNYYKTTVYITKFERSLGIGKRDNLNSQSNLVYNFYNAFPVSVNSMPVSYDSSQLLKCTISFTYDRYSQSSRPIAGIFGSELPTSPQTSVGVPNIGTLPPLTPSTQAVINQNSFSNTFDLGIPTSNIFNNTSSNQYNASAGTSLNNTSQLTNRAFSSDLEFG